MTGHRLRDGTPIPDHLTIAHQEAEELEYEASRVNVALRSLAGALSDEDDPLADRHRAGLCEAIELVGDYLSLYSAARTEFMDRLARIHHAEHPPTDKPPKARRRTVAEVRP